MKERGILFNAQMINAILSGRKTQTRRIIKPKLVTTEINYETLTEKKELRYDLVNCRYGRPGDRLYVKERINYNGEHDNFYYAADNKGCGLVTYNRLKKKTCPSILMPKICHRIMLEITNIRAERVVYITNEDAIAEGWPHIETMGKGVDLDEAYPITWFSKLWESVNGAGSWEANDLVRVIEFKVLDNNGG